ncbi:MAG: beta-ketoacyl synthase chain length factor [Steroidobacteraceae bacterium]
MNVVYVESISYAAPGLPDWQTVTSALRGEHAYVASELPVYQPTLLPPNERRRASPTVRLAFRVAEAATDSSSIPAAELAAVFASSDGDLSIAQRICTALAKTQRLISPTDFHNSVHNAAAGYWSIASAAQGPSTSIAAFDHSFAVGLMEAIGLVLVEQQATLLVAYDVPSPTPLHSKRPLSAPVGVGLVLTPQHTPNTLATLRITTTNTPPTTMQDVKLEALRLGNPAARALPLLQLLANQQTGIVVLSLPNATSVAVHVVDDRS